MARRKAKSGIRWRLWLTALVWCAIFISTAVAAAKAHDFMLTDPRFMLSSEQRGAITLEGAEYASRTRLLRVFAGDYGRSIFAVPLAERRRRLLAVDWVSDASVSRIWPSRLLVRITERKPVAFVSMPLHSGAGSPARYLLVDADGVLLDPPLRARFTFPLLSGVTEDQTEPERRVRVRAMLRLMEELGPSGQNISVVNAATPDDLAVVAQVDGHPLDLRLGDGDYAKRFQNFLSHYPEIYKRAPNLRTFDLRLEDRITAKE
jgi:cell division protein FtsQ